MQMRNAEAADESPEVSYAAVTASPPRRTRSTFAKGVPPREKGLPYKGIIRHQKREKPVVFFVVKGILGQKYYDRSKIRFQN